MQIDQVNWIDIVLGHLHPVAGRRNAPLGDEAVAGHLERIEDRKLGFQLGRAHVAEDHALVFDRRVSAVKEALSQNAVLRLARSVENASVRRIEPTVVAAAQALTLNGSEFERGPAMAAMLGDQADVAGSVAEPTEVLPHE